jgi:DDE_Tnp_1-associated
VLAGAGGPTAIAKWAALKAELLTQVLPLPNGIPRKDVFRRVLALLQQAAFQACFVTWLQSLRAQAAAATEVDQPVLAVDGKTLRRSHDRSKGLGALHCVILRAARSETSSNSWKFRVISDASCAACVVGTRSNTS